MQDCHRVSHLLLGAVNKLHVHLCFCALHSALWLLILCSPPRLPISHPWTRKSKSMGITYPCASLAHGRSSGVLVTVNLMMEKQIDTFPNFTSEGTSCLMHLLPFLLLSRQPPRVRGVPQWTWTSYSCDLGPLCGRGPGSALCVFLLTQQAPGLNLCSGTAFLWLSRESQRLHPVTRHCQFCSLSIGWAGCGLGVGVPLEGRAASHTARTSMCNDGEGSEKLWTIRQSVVPQHNKAGSLKTFIVVGIQYEIYPFNRSLSVQYSIVGTLL